MRPRARAWLAAALLALWALAPARASAFVPLACHGVEGLAHYATGAPPALGVFTGDPVFDGAARSAMERWNEVQRAGTVLVEQPASAACALDDGEQASITWDSGECGGLPPEVQAWTVYHFDPDDPCLVRESDVVFNGAAAGIWTSPLVLAIALHELGHLLLFDHEWNRLSVMGYWRVGAPPPLFLFADDVAGLRSLYPEDGPATEDLQLHAYRLLVPPLHDIESLDHVDFPVCSRPHDSQASCLTAATGDSVSAELTVENVGAAPHVGPLAAQLTLVNRSSGARFPLAEATWDSFAPATSWSGVLEGELGAELPDGSYDVELRLDPALLAPDDPAPERHRLVLTGSVELNLATAQPPAQAYLGASDEEGGCGCTASKDGLGLVALLWATTILGQARRRGAASWASRFLQLSPPRPGSARDTSRPSCDTAATAPRGR